MDSGNIWLGGMRGDLRGRWLSVRGVGKGDWSGVAEDDWVWVVGKGDCKVWFMWTQFGNDIIHQCYIIFLTLSFFSLFTSIRFLYFSFSNKQSRTRDKKFWGQVSNFSRETMDFSRLHSLICHFFSVLVSPRNLKVFFYHLLVQ